MKVSDFDYELPRESIAQEPAARREAARLLVHHAAEDKSWHLTIADLPALLQPGDLVVVNDTRVRRARLFVRRPSGGRVELFLLGPVEPDSGGAVGVPVWRALANPARKLRVGETLEIETPSGALELDWRLEPLERLAHEAEPDKPGPMWILAFRRATAPASGHADVPLEEQLEALIERVGHVPLPPYIMRHQGRGPAEAEHEARDAKRYQTVFAREPGAVAAPTAGLHLSHELLVAFARKGIEVASVTLHVGLGTFAPVEVADTCDHPMHTEAFELPAATVDAVAACRSRGGRVVAIGTTSVRVLESATNASGKLSAGPGRTNLFLTPGAPFRAVDVLLTNFHLPKSTLLMLVSAFIGRERTLALYREAIAQGYRFFSYGDAMLLVRDPAARR